MEQLTMDFTPKEIGIQQVIDNNFPEYSKVKTFALNWIKTQYSNFTAEDLKTAYLSLNEPVRQQNIYGAVFSSLSKSKLITVVGSENATLPNAHGRLLRVWRAVA